LRRAQVDDYSTCDATSDRRKSAFVPTRACRKSDVSIVLQNETGTTRPLQDDEMNIRLAAAPQVEIKIKEDQPKIKSFKCQNENSHADNMHVNSTRNPATPTKKMRPQKNATRMQ